jgi:hypothetical protein
MVLHNFGSALDPMELGDAPTPNFSLSSLHHDPVNYDKTWSLSLSESRVLSCIASCEGRWQSQVNYFSTTQHCGKVAQARRE